MAEASDARGARRDDAEFFPLNDLPNDVLVSVFEAVGNPVWVRYTFPLVCKAWNELYCSEDASPLHETLVVDFDKEVERAEAMAREERRRRRPVEGAPPRLPVVDASRVISWAQRRAGWVRKLHLVEVCYETLEDFTAEGLGTLVAVVGPSLTEISIQFDLDQLCERPFWRSLRTSVVPFGKLRSLVVEGIESVVDEADVEPLAQLAGSLEELELLTYDEESSGRLGLPRFPESFFSLKELRRLVMDGHPQIKAIPAGISSLKKLEELDLRCCGLSSLPKELGQLSRLTKLDLSINRHLGTTRPALVDRDREDEFLDEDDEEESSDEEEFSDEGDEDEFFNEDPPFDRNLRTPLPAAEAFPAELGGMTSLRVLNLQSCRLRTVPAFVGKLKSLEVLDLSHCRLSSLPKELGELSGLTSLKLGGNENLGSTAAAFPAELGGMKSLRELNLYGCGLRTLPAFVGGLESLEILKLDFSYGDIVPTLDLLIESCPRLRAVTLGKLPGADPWTPESRARLEDFKAKLLAVNPNAKVSY